MNQSTTPTDVSMTMMSKPPAYPSMDTMTTEKTVDPSVNQCQARG
jgi:hypothetical protein